MMQSGAAIPEDFTTLLLTQAGVEKLTQSPACDAVALLRQGDFLAAAHAVALLRQGDFLAAAHALDELTLRTDAPPMYWLLAGYSYLAAGDPGEALYFLDLALRREPGLALAHYCKGLAHLKARDFLAAQSAFSAARQRMPQLWAAAVYEASALCELHRYAESLEILNHVRSKFPFDPDVLIQTSLVLLRGFGRAREALEFCDLALAQPGAKDARRASVNKALALRCLGNYGESVGIYDQLLAEFEDPYVRWQRSLALLTAGDFGRAWEDYGLRWVNTEARRHEFSFPEWQPPARPGETILVLSEQGLGDQIMFASCLPDLLRAASGSGAKIVLECEPRLVALFQSAFPDVQVVARERDDDAALLRRVPKAHCRQIFLGDLPRLYRRTRTDFPERLAYLTPDSERSDYWKARLAGLGPEKKIGISWRGGSPATNGSLRSVGLAALAPLLQTGTCQFVSLQYGDYTADLSSLDNGGVRIHCFPDALADYDETAGLIDALDAVVSVSTSVVHLAGALGKPVAVLIPAVPEWAFGGPDDTMPWYPSVRLFRQSVLGQWEDPVKRAQAFISAL